jgi:glycosyltransferase involved in cell wall biosynthesis
MKIIYISNSVIPSRSASGVNVMKMCQAFAASGHEVTLLVRTRSRREREDIFQYYGVQTNFKIKTFFEPENVVLRIGSRGWRFLSRVVKGNKLERMRSMSEYGLRCWEFLSGLGDSSALAYGRYPQGIYAAVRDGFCSIYESHHPPFSKQIYEIENEIFKSPYFKRLVVISEALKKEYLKLFSSLEEDKVLVAPDGADVPDTKKDESGEVPNWRGREGSLQVGYVGALYRGKGMELISELAPLMGDVDLHIVGGDESDLNYWKKKIHQSNVHFYGFVVPRSLDAYYRKFDVVLAPYQKEVFIAPRDVAARWNIDISRWNSPLKIFEYMAYSKPIIASNLLVIKEILRDGENALLCDPEDVESWQAAILGLKDSMPLRRKLGTQAFKDLQDKYTWIKRARNVICGINCEQGKF